MMMMIMIMIMMMMMMMMMHPYIFRRLFTALLKLGLRFIFTLKRNFCVVESVYCSCDHKDDVDNDDCD